MAAKPFIETRRIILRQWREEDKPALALLNADPDVMRYFPNTVLPVESNALVDRLKSRIAAKGYGLFAAEDKETQRCIGFIGLSEPSFEAHFTPCVEIGWRLDRSFWGRGLATEGGRAVVSFAFNALGLEELVSFTSTVNLPSIRVMQKLGMTSSPAENFAHPKLPRDHELAPHVLYRLQRPDQHNG